MSNNSLLEQMYESIGINPHELKADKSVARIEIHHNKVLGVHLVPGLEVDADQTDYGINARIRVTPGTVIDKPVQVCFGMIPETGLQQIVLDIQIDEGARAGIFAHCTFPNAREIRHEMDAAITVAPGAEYAYFERHVHGGTGGVTVVPRSKVRVMEGARYQTDFEILHGRVGKMEIDLAVEAEAHSVTEINARLRALGDDRIEIDETIHLAGEAARGVLNSSIALKDNAEAEVRNTILATAPYSRGHVNCKEIVQGNAIARAIPIVDVRNPKAHVTHEAAIGSVDNKQLETLMSRGLDEDEASDLIIRGLLRG